MIHAKNHNYSFITTATVLVRNIQADKLASSSSFFEVLNTLLVWTRKIFEWHWYGQNVIGRTTAQEYFWNDSLWIKIQLWWKQEETKKTKNNQAWGGLNLLMWEMNENFFANTNQQEGYCGANCKERCVTTYSTSLLICLHSCSSVRILMLTSVHC